MKVMMVSKALVVGAYRTKLHEIAAHSDVDLVAVAPPSWRQSTFELPSRSVADARFDLVVSPIFANGNFHLFFFPELGRLMDQHRPDVLHVDEEAYNLATFMAVWAARKRHIPSIFFTWQNLNRRYPLPFAAMERYVYRTARHAIAGTEAAARVLRDKGYRGDVSVIPQFGVDPEHFVPAIGAARESDEPFTIGFAGRLVAEKGVDSLVEACAGLPFDWRLVILGEGPELPRIRELARARGVETCIEIRGSVPSTDMPRHLQRFDALALASLTRPNWAEQFGRVLIEAMACGVPVVGSTCGEIPDVVGDAGLLFAEGDSGALRSALTQLHDDMALRARLAAKGRQRVLDRFTHERIAAETVAIYRSLANRGTEPARRS